MKKQFAVTSLFVGADYQTVYSSKTGEEKGRITKSVINFLMQSELTIYNEFAEAAMLNNPRWLYRKKESLTLAMFEIISCEQPDWWYAKFIGMEFLGRIKWDSYHEELYGVKSIREVEAVAMVRNKYYQSGRSLSAKDVIMI